MPPPSEFLDGDGGSRDGETVREEAEPHRGSAITGEGLRGDNVEPLCERGSSS